MCAVFLCLADLYHHPQQTCYSRCRHRHPYQFSYVCALLAAPHSLMNAKSSGRRWHCHSRGHDSRIRAFCKIRSDRDYLVSACQKCFEGSHKSDWHFQAGFCGCHRPLYYFCTLLSFGPCVCRGRASSFSNEPQHKHKTGFPATDDLVNRVIRCACSLLSNVDPFY